MSLVNDNQLMIFDDVMPVSAMKRNDVAGNIQTGSIHVGSSKRGSYSNVWRRYKFVAAIRG